MNYFELFNIPVQLKVDPATLTSKYFELSREFHPDYFANENEARRNEVLEQSAQLNKAYKIFRNPDETIRYVLMQKGLVEEEEKYELPPAFLMEVLELNEQLMEVDESSKPALETAINNLQAEIYEPVKEIVENYQEGITSEKELLQVKEYYYKKKYLDRLKKNVGF
jgi:molecular chaperone HscB